MPPSLWLVSLLLPSFSPVGLTKSCLLSVSHSVVLAQRTRNMIASGRRRLEGGNLASTNIDVPRVNNPTANLGWIPCLLKKVWLDPEKALLPPKPKPEPKTVIVPRSYSSFYSQSALLPRTDSEPDHRTLKTDSNETEPLCARGPTSSPLWEQLKVS